MIAPEIASLLAEDLHAFAASGLPVVAPPPAPRRVAARTARRAPQDIVGKPKILVVDDEPINIKIVKKHLSSVGYHDVISTTDPRQAAEMARVQQPDLLLLDVMMPEVSGLEVLEQVSLEPETADIPVIILTASTDKETRIKALRLGANDLLNKPIDPIELMPRVRNSLVVKAHLEHLRNAKEDLEREVASRTAELCLAQAELVACLARASEYRDDETGNHVRRVGQCVSILALELGLEPRLANLIGQAATLHDIGKIGVSDQILRKPGPLDDNEREAMRRHCEFGGRIMEGVGTETFGFVSHTDVGASLLGNATSPVLRMAARIALTHHERWDGTGYPLGLAGEKIPLEGRITAVADVFDALRSERPYKPPLPMFECLSIMAEGRGKHFDPAVLDAFFRRQDEILALRS